MAAPVTPPGDKETALYVGVNLEIQGRDVILAPKTPINQIAEKGIELELPSDLYLGKAGEIIDGLAQEFGYSERISTKKTDITIVDNLIKKVMDAELTISDLYIKVYPDPKDKENHKLIPSPNVKNGTGEYFKVNEDGTKDSTPVKVEKKDDGKYYIGTGSDAKELNVPPKQTEYTLGLAATWSQKDEGAEEKLGSKFKLKGLYIMITNEDMNAIEGRKLKQKSLAASVPSSTTASKKSNSAAQAQAGTD
jgi:hypothetical protein